MKVIVGLFLVLEIIIFLTCNISFAQEIKLSFGPICNDGMIVCHDPNEVAVCFSADTGIHLEKIIIDGQVVNQYQPTCNSYEGTELPTCSDITQEGKLAPSYIFLNCIEFPKCTGEQNKLSVICSDGKIAKCLGGNDEEPNCLAGENSMCVKGVPVCDYSWQANASTLK